MTQLTQHQPALTSIGLSPSAARLYLRLAYTKRAAPARFINETLQMPKATLFRALRELIRKGFIDCHHVVHERSYFALPLSEALTNYALFQRQQTVELQKALDRLT